MKDFFQGAFVALGGIFICLVITTGVWNLFDSLKTIKYNTEQIKEQLKESHKCQPN